MAKIKEEVGPRHGIIVHLSREMWLHRGHPSSLREMNGPDFSLLIILEIDIISYKNITLD